METHIKHIYERKSANDCERQVFRYKKGRKMRKIKNKYEIIITDEPEYGLQNMVGVYTKGGGYIGLMEDAMKLFKRGIYDIRLADKKNKCCSIGFNEEEQKWYGWSHRAIYGFGIGFIVPKGMSQDGDLEIGFEVKNLKDAKKVAISFAKSVS